MNIWFVLTALLWLAYLFFMSTVHKMVDYPPMDSTWNLLNFIAFLVQWGCVIYLSFVGAGKILEGI